MDKMKWSSTRIQATTHLFLKIGWIGFLLCASVFSLYGTSFEGYAPYQITAKFAGGWIFPHDEDIIKPLTKGPVLGGEIGFEWRTDGSKEWHKHFNLPDVGLSLQVLDFHNPEIMGQMISVLSYTNLPLVKTNTVQFGIKIGGGLGFCTRPCDREAAIADPRSIKNKAEDYNFAIGGPVNFAIEAGLNLDIRVHEHLSVTADILYNHFSSASLSQPNAGLNLFNGYLGLKYLPVYKPYVHEPTQKNCPIPLKKRWSGEVILSGGAKKLYYKDSQYFGCASLNVEGYYHTCHQHRIGLGLDLFYDGAYVQTVEQNEDGVWVRKLDQTEFARTFTTEDNIANKFRLGLNIANELTVGKVGIFFHFGIYLYDPVKDMEPWYSDHKNNGKEPHKDRLDDLNAGIIPEKKGMFYGYDINQEDGWNYFRIGVKYHITPHFLVNVSFKTHLQKVEFAEFGLGYSF